MTDWTWAAARARGTSHAKSGTACQDAFHCRLINGTLIAVVADGAGSAEFGGQGAALASRTFMDSAAAYITSAPNQPGDDLLWSWIDAARDRISVAARRRNAAPRAFASTLICAFAGPGSTTLLHIGDGAAALRLDACGGWSVPLWPAHGEYASTTFFLTDDPSPQVRIQRVDGACNALVVMSDGLERLALDFTNRVPHQPFFEGIVKPVAGSAVQGRDVKLSRKLCAYLGSESVNARTDDDKTLVVAVRR